MPRPCFARCRSPYETETPLIQTRPCVGSCDADTSGFGLSCRASIAEAQRHGEGRAGTPGLHAVKGTPGRVRKSLSSLIQQTARVSHFHADCKVKVLHIGGI
jgi:hypothetical protein